MTICSMEEVIQKKKTYLADEIMEQILLKLPAESLVRFKSVRKQWFSLISHPSFVQSHLKHVLSNLKHNQKIMTLIMKSFPDYISEFYVLNNNHHDGNTSTRVHHKYNLPFFSKAPDHIHLISSCNGLICLGIFPEFEPSASSSYGFNPILWNPLSNDYKQVPFFNVCIYKEWFGFGYDSHSQDYKLVRFKKNNGEAEVYGLKSSSMRLVPFEQLDISRPALRFNDYIGRYMNGSLYWLYEPRILEVGFIVFNLRYEKFRFLKFPNTSSFFFQRITFSTVVRDCQLDVFFYNPHKKFFHLVTMEEDSMNGSISWRSINIQNPCLGKNLRFWPICLMMNGDIVMDIKDDGCSNQRIIYNPEQKMTKNIPMIPQEAKGFGYWRVEYTTYIETLVLPSNLINCSAP